MFGLTKPGKASNMLRNKLFAQQIICINPNRKGDVRKMSVPIIGNVPRGDDYFGQEILIQNIWDKLEKNNILLAAPGDRATGFKENSFGKTNPSIQAPAFFTGGLGIHIRGQGESAL